MRIAYLLIRFVLLTALLGVVHITVGSLFPFPYSTLNIFFVVFTLHILFFEKGSVVWLAFATHFLIELYGTLPFGITLFSATMAVLIGYWLFQSLFTNRTWYTTAALCLALLVTYRVLFCALLFIVQQTGSQEVVWGPLFLNVVWESISSTVLVTIIYSAVQRFRLSPKRQQSIFMRL